MGYDRIILIVAVVMCRTAVLQVLSQATNPDITNSTNFTTKPTIDLSPNTTEIYVTTVELDCERRDIFPNCSYCNSSGIDDTWVCYECVVGYEQQDAELCTLSMPNNASKRCCVAENSKDPEIWIIVGSVGGVLGVTLIVILIVALLCHRRKRRKRSRAEPPLPPPVDTNRVHIDADGTRYKFDKKGNKVFDFDIEMDDRPPLAPPLDVPHPPLPDDSNQVYGNDPDQVRMENTGRQPQPPRLPGQPHLPKPALPSHQKPFKTGEPPRAPPPVPVKDQGTAAALRPPNPPPKPKTPTHQWSKQQPPAPPKPKPKPAVSRKGGHTSPSPQEDFQDTYEIPDAEKQDFGETYDDVASDNNAFDWQESYDDVDIPHEGQPESDGEDYEPVPKPTLQSPPQSPFGHITQERIIREYGDDKLYQNQPVLDSKTKTSYRYRNLAMTKGEKIESEAPYLVKR